MNIIKCVDADGKINRVAVTDEVYEAIQQLDKQEHLDERRETRRCQSLEVSMDNGWDIVDPYADIKTIIDKKERYKKLYAALNTLPKEQQQLIYLVFFKGVSQQDIAQIENVSKAAISARITRILKKLKKLLE